MQSIMAGPEGNADIGQEIEVDSKTAKKLLAGKFATKISGGRSHETAAINPAEIVERERQAAREKAVAEQAEAEQAEQTAKSPDAVKAALDLLDPANDDDGTGGGKPAIDQMRQLTGSTSLSRAEIEEMFPDFKRPATGEPNLATSPDDAVRTNKP